MNSNNFFQVAYNIYKQRLWQLNSATTIYCTYGLTNKNIGLTNIGRSSGIGFPFAILSIEVSVFSEQVRTFPLVHTL